MLVGNIFVILNRLQQKFSKTFLILLKTEIQNTIHSIKNPFKTITAAIVISVESSGVPTANASDLTVEREKLRTITFFEFKIKLFLNSNF